MPHRRPRFSVHKREGLKLINSDQKVVAAFAAGGMSGVGPIAILLGAFALIMLYALT